MKIPFGFWDKTCKDRLFFSGASHAIVVAKTRAGKFQYIYGPILLSVPHNCFVLCPKGQSPAVSARYRRDVLKHDVKILNPFGIFPEELREFEHVKYCPITSKLNPKSKTLAIDADILAEGFLPFTSPDQHWVLGARKLVSGIAMHLRLEMNQWSLPDIYTVVCDPNLYAFCAQAINEGCSSYVANRLGRFAGDAARDNKEIRSIVSAAIQGLGWVDNEPIRDNMGGSTIDLRDMRKRPMTVFVVGPEEYLMTCAAPWMRTVTNAWASVCLEPGASEYPNLGLLMEMATTVGNLSSVDTLNAMGAGHKCQLISEFQDLNQLVELKPKSWQTWLANAGLHVYLGAGIGDLFTAGHISKMTGQIEVPSVSRTINDQGHGVQLSASLLDGINRGLRSLGGGDGTQVNMGLRQRPYMLPEEVIEMSEEMLVFAEGVRGVIRAGRKPYYQDPEFAGRYDEDPYHAKKS